MAVKKLYANGDSWTYGQELNDDQPGELDYKFYNTWPWWLAQRMDIPQVINDSLGGCSCDRIFRTTLNYIKSQKDISDTIFVLGWTSPERFEFPLVKKESYHDGYHTNTWEEIHYLCMLFSSPLVPVVDGDKREWNDKIARLNQLKDRWFRLRDYEVDKEKVKQYIYILNELVHLKGSKIYHVWALGNIEKEYSVLPCTLNELTTKNNWPRLPHRHPTVESHQKIADTIYDAIISKGQ